MFKELISVLQKLFIKKKKVKKTLSTLYEVSVTLISKEKKSLQADIANEYRCKDPQQGNSLSLQNSQKKQVDKIQQRFKIQILKNLGLEGEFLNLKMISIKSLQLKSYLMAKD